MRKNEKCLILLISIILLLFLSSCSPKKSNSEKEISSLNTYEENNINKSEEEILIEFNNMIKEEKEPYELVNYIDENIEKTSKDVATIMIENFLKVQENYIEVYSDELFKDNRQVIINKIYSEDNLDIKNIDNIDDEATKEILKIILKGKYKIINIEGAYYPEIDYNKLKNYSKYLTQEITEYIEIKNIESENPFLIGTSLVITWDELSERLIGVEEYLVKYPETLRLEELLRLYGEYLLIYLEGVKDTPNYDYITKELYDDVLESYKKLIANNKGGITKDIIERYLSILEENDNKINEEVKGKIIDLYNEAINRLEEL